MWSQVSGRNFLVPHQVTKNMESKCYGLQRGENMFQYVAAEIVHLYNIIQLFWCIRYLFKIFQACFMSTSRRMRTGSEEEYSQYSWFAPIIIGYIEPHINPVIAGWICPPSGEVVPPRTSCSLSFTKRWWCYFSSIGFQDSKVPSKRAPPQFTSRFWWMPILMLSYTTEYYCIVSNHIWNIPEKKCSNKNFRTVSLKKLRPFFFLHLVNSHVNESLLRGLSSAPLRSGLVTGHRNPRVGFTISIWCWAYFLGSPEISRQWLFNYWATIWTLS